MASQLRLRVVLPVAVLGILGLGVGAFATTRSAPEDPGAIPPPAQTTTKTPKPDKTDKPNKPRARAPLEAALRKHSVVVVLFYAPGDGYDTIQTRETRAGALDGGAGFLAIDVTKNRSVAALAARYEVRDAPATVVFKRGPTVVYRIAGYLDRVAIAQAAADARA
jgi:hypothetical protein